MITISVDYYVQIDSDAFKDSADNFFAGITDITTWKFQTAAAIVTSFASPVQNPFGLTAITNTYVSGPIFADLDGDGDMDLFAVLKTMRK